MDGHVAGSCRRSSLAGRGGTGRWQGGHGVEDNWLGVGEGKKRMDTRGDAAAVPRARSEKVGKLPPLMVVEGGGDGKLAESCRRSSAFRTEKETSLLCYENPRFPKTSDSGKLLDFRESERNENLKVRERTSESPTLPTFPQSTEKL